MITWDEVMRMIRAVLRWWWLPILAVAISVGIAYYFTRDEPRYYNSTATVMIGDSYTSVLPEQDKLALSSSLAKYYRQIISREQVLKPVQEKLSLPFPWQHISYYMIYVALVPDSSLIEIRITDTDPQRAALIANEIAKQLIAISPNSPDKIAADRQLIEQQISDTVSRLEERKLALQNLTSTYQGASGIDNAIYNTQLSNLEAAIQADEINLRNLISLKNNSNINNINIVGEAIPSTSPLPSKRLVVIASAGAGGLIISLLAILLIEYLRTSWKGSRDIKDRFQLEPLGQLQAGSALCLDTSAQREQRYEQVFTIQNNIVLAAAENGLRSLMLTSPYAHEQRSILSLDLAELFANAGYRVLLVDVDFTTALLTRLLNTTESSQGWVKTSATEDDDLWSYLRSTPITNVALLAGPTSTPGHPAIISSKRWKELHDRLLEIADIVIFDGPSVLASADAALLAPHVDGTVLVLDPKVHRRVAIEQVTTRLKRHSQTIILGAVSIVGTAKQTPLLEEEPEHAPKLLAENPDFEQSIQSQSGEEPIDVVDDSDINAEKDDIIMAEPSNALMIDGDEIETDAKQAGKPADDSDEDDDEANLEEIEVVESEEELLKSKSVAAAD